MFDDVTLNLYNMERRVLISCSVVIVLCIFTLLFTSLKPTIPVYAFHLSRKRIVQNGMSQPKHLNAMSIGIVNTTIAQTRVVTTPPSTYVVPNIVHYIWFGKNRVMAFHQMVSALSALKLLHPEYIMLHCDFVPTGKYWRQLITSVNFTVVKMKPPEQIFRHKLKYIEHKSDIARFIILLKYGGIYLDWDSIVLKSFDSLRKYDFVMGQESQYSLVNAILISKKNATFLHIWRETYRNFTSTEWAYHSCQIPFQLHKQYPQHIHVDKDRLINPGYPSSHLIFDLHTKFDWSKNYAIHLYYRVYKHRKTYNITTIRKLDSVFGQVSRYVLFGNSSIV